MGKKGSWFSAIKRVFTPHSKEKLGNEAERKNVKEKRKKGFGKLRRGEPSSIEKIFGEAERDHNLFFRPSTPPDRSNPPSASPPIRPASPRVASPRAASPRVASPRAASPKSHPPTRADLPRLDSPRSLSPKPSEPSSASASAPPPPLKPASTRVPSARVASPRAASPKSHPPPRVDPPNLDSPRSLSPKPYDRSTPSSASASAPPPLKPASTRVPSQRTSPPIVPSPRVVSPQAVPQKLPSPRADPLRLNNPRPSSPKPPSARADPPCLDAPRPPSPRAEPPRLDTPRAHSPKPPSPRAHSPKPPSPRAEPPRVDSPRPTTPRPPSPRPVSPRPVQRREILSRPEPTLLVQHASATKIQATFRGYMARRSFRALKGLVRLQGVVRGHSVKRQTVNAMKYMQQLVRVQSQIQSRRIKMLDKQAQLERDEAKWAASEAGNGNWDDSVLTKEERDARSQRKTDAIIKRERSMAYAYSHKLWKNSPKSAHVASGGLPLWWNWMDRQLPLASPARSHSQPIRDYRLTPTRLSPSPLSQSSNQHHFRHDSNFDASTPKSSRSTLLTPSRPIRTGTSRYSRGRQSGQDSPFTDNDSLTSCPPFPSYMAPTVSAKAKVRPSSNPKERVMGTPSSVSSERRRMSYPPTQQGMDTFRWNKGSLIISNSGSQRGSGSGSPGGVVLEKHKTLKSVGNLSIGSTVSMPDGRKPFNRYV